MVERLEVCAPGGRSVGPGALDSPGDLNLGLHPLQPGDSCHLGGLMGGCGFPPHQVGPEHPDLQLWAPSEGHSAQKEGLYLQ